MGVWIHWYVNDRAWQEQALPHLNSHLPLDPVGELSLAPHCLSGPGIICFDHASAELCSFVQRWSEGGRQRLLLIAREPAALAEIGPWSLLRAGAAEVLVWSELPEPAVVVGALLRRWIEIDALLAEPFVREHLVGDSPVWRQVLRQVIEVARFTDAPVLLLGETGTGKEALARLIHLLDPRPAKGDLVIVDCTTIVPELAGSELFGHERGAFTGAIAPRDGAIALADGGTLFLDEVGELPLPLQAQLLRVTQEHTYKRVGGNTWRQSKFRLICATNRDLRAEVEAGRFRRDLYYRIAGFVCAVPPLADRREDILPLARHFIRQLCPDHPPELSASVAAYLLSRNFPGNVRDLRQLVARMLLRYPGVGVIGVGAVPDDERPVTELPARLWSEGLAHIVRAALEAGYDLRAIRRTVEEIVIHEALTASKHNLSQAARILGVTTRALQLRRAAQRQFTDVLAH